MTELCRPSRNGTFNQPQESLVALSHNQLYLLCYFSNIGSWTREADGSWQASLAAVQISPIDTTTYPPLCPSIHPSGDTSEKNSRYMNRLYQQFESLRARQLTCSSQIHI